MASEKLPTELKNSQRSEAIVDIDSGWDEYRAEGREIVTALSESDPLFAELYKGLQTTQIELFKSAGMTYDADEVSSNIERMLAGEYRVQTGLKLRLLSDDYKDTGFQPDFVKATETMPFNPASPSVYLEKMMNTLGKDIRLNAYLDRIRSGEVSADIVDSIDYSGSLEDTEHLVPEEDQLIALTAIKELVPNTETNNDSMHPRSHQLEYEVFSKLVSTEQGAKAIFTYDSVAGAADRVNWVDTSESASRYAGALHELSDYAEGYVYDAIKSAVSNTEKKLYELSVIPSDWTKDGGWAAWDYGKQAYFEAHPDEQKQHIRTDLDRKYYTQSKDRLYLDKEAAVVIANRQVAWEVLEQPHANTNKLIGLVLENSSDNGVNEKLKQKLAGETVSFRSSELAEVGRLLSLLPTQP